MARMSDCPSPLGTICVDLDCPLHYPYGLEKHRHAKGVHAEENPPLLVVENNREVTCGICLERIRNHGIVESTI